MTQLWCSIFETLLWTLCQWQISISAQSLLFHWWLSSTQYKNFKNLTNLIFHQNDFHIQAECNFFSTWHGKDACNRVGGTIKRPAAHASLQHPFSNQTSPNSNYLILRKPMLIVFFVSSEEVLSNNGFLELWFATSSLFKGHRVTINPVSLLQAFVLQWRRYHLWNTWKKLAWLMVAAAKCRWQLKILTQENSMPRIELSN